ncbi:MAG: hypothetical protein J5603_07770, partial [Bacteroidales bacterium]|nr:hypothetical protein [Bacteroidales bacterium]
IWAKPPSVIIVRLANQHYYTSGGFFLEAEAHWEHTCIAGGLFVPSIQKHGGCLSASAMFLITAWYHFNTILGTIFITQTCVALCDDVCP